MSLVALRSRVDQISKVPTEIVSQAADGDRDACINAALQRYNTDRPRSLVATVSALGANTYEYNLTSELGDWNDGQYTLLRIEYPSGKQDDQTVDSNSWRVYQKADGDWYLRFTQDAPGAGEDMLLEYLAPHAVTSDSDTVSSSAPNDIEPFCQLAAHYVLLEAAAYYAANKGLSTLSADTVSYQTKSQECAAAAKRCLERYEAHVNAGGPSSFGTSFLDMDTTDRNGRDYIFWERWRT